MSLTTRRHYRKIGVADNAGRIMRLLYQRLGTVRTDFNCSCRDVLRRDDRHVNPATGAKGFHFQSDILAADC